LKSEIDKLPAINYRLLKVLCFMLYNITKAYQITLMKPSNLAIVFGPVFSSPPLNSTSQKGILASLPKLSTAAETLIVCYHSIFEEDPKHNILDFLIKCDNNLNDFINKKKEFDKNFKSEENNNTIENNIKIENNNIIIIENNIEENKNGEIKNHENIESKDIENKDHENKNEEIINVQKHDIKDNENKNGETKNNENKDIENKDHENKNGEKNNVQKHEDDKTIEN
jgi:hypothetical protein